MTEYEKKLEANSKLLNTMLTTVGCSPTQSAELNSLRMCITLCLTIYGTTVTFYSMYLAWPDNLEQCAYNVTPFLASGLISLNLLNFMVYRKDTFTLMKTVKEKFWYDNINGVPQEKEVILRYSRYMSLCNMAQAGIMFSASPLWMLRPLAEMYLSARDSSNQTFRRILPFKNWLPFDLDPYSDPIYEIIYILQIFTTYYITSGLTAVGCIYYYLVLSTCAQFKLVQMGVREFDKNETGTECTLDVQEHKLRKSIELHQDLLLFCTKLESVMTIHLFLEFFVGILFLCTAGFIMTMFPGNIYIYLHSGLCLTAGIVEIFLHCLPATMLTTEGLGIAHAAYESDWYNAPLHIQRMLVFTIARAQQPVYLTAGKLTKISVEAFETITRTAASYFTVLTSMRE